MFRITLDSLEVLPETPFPCIQFERYLARNASSVDIAYSTGFTKGDEMPSVPMRRVKIEGLHQA